MAMRDYDSAPISETLGLGRIIAGLSSDLDELRDGKISVNDAVARSLLAKQIFNGVRIYLNGTKLLTERALPVGPARPLETPNVDDGASRSATKASSGMPKNPLPTPPAEEA